MNYAEARHEVVEEHLERRRVVGKVPKMTTKEVVREPLYDTFKYNQKTAAAIDSDICFFRSGRGCAAIWGERKSLLDTNMDIAGRLPNPKTFDVYGVAVDVPSVEINDNSHLQTRRDTLIKERNLFRSVLKEHAHFEFRVGSKSYLRVPVSWVLDSEGTPLRGLYQRLNWVPESSSGHLVEVATEEKSTYPVFIRHDSEPEGESYPIHIPTAQSFSAKVCLHGGKPKVDYTHPIVVYLDGLCWRPIM